MARHENLDSHFPGGSAVKYLPANEGDAGDTGLISGLGRSPGGGNGNPPQYSWVGNPMDRGAWQVTVHGVADWVTEHTLTEICIEAGLKGTHLLKNKKDYLVVGETEPSHLRWPRSVVCGQPDVFYPPSHPVIFWDMYPMQSFFSPCPAFQHFRLT